MTATQSLQSLRLPQIAGHSSAVEVAHHVGFHLVSQTFPLPPEPGPELVWAFKISSVRSYLSVCVRFQMKINH